MKRHTEYIIEEELAIIVKKVCGKISDADFKGKYGLSDSETILLHEFYDLVREEDKE